MRTVGRFYCSYLEASDFSKAKGIYDQFALTHRMIQQFLNMDSISTITKYKKCGTYLLMDVELSSTKEFADMFFEAFWGKFMYYIVDKVDEFGICVRFMWKGKGSNE